MVRVTSARPSGGREAVPAKTTSSILPPRRLLAPCSPITQAKASTMFDLPDPFGPTTQVIPGSNRSEVAEAKDLNPRRVRLFTYTRGLSSLRSWPRRHSRFGVRGSPPGLTPRARRSRAQALGQPAFPHLTASGRRSWRFARQGAGRGAPLAGRNRRREAETRPGAN